MNAQDLIRQEWEGQCVPKVESRKKPPGAYVPQKPGAAYESGFFKETEHVYVLRHPVQGTSLCDL